MLMKNMNSKGQRGGRETSSDITEQTQARNEMVLRANIVTAEMVANLLWNGKKMKRIKDESFVIDLKNEVSW